MRLALKQHTVLPGFGLTLGYTLMYLGLIVLLPLSSLFLKTATMGWERFWQTVSDPRAVASYRLTFGASLAAAIINGGVRVPGGVDIGAITVSPRQAAGGCDGGPALYAADGRLGQLP